ncbi:hypothetical protein [Brevundimonas subvibrioides]|uniref:Lipoprotein n=1 Tax=Brevundimonas subvibrioides (strain ATCC 15264 / DSM 4735 / LMG 14903 / NBRC 16000 / CB 81) TaxID=633149 RepID=D9QJ02_BRESC|nr:hypothetical protein [Brevundimonas subvibrioides]ADK99526.1 conserved hypothetical protein [Brevundimonas subvibrioides ATCC 15264]
MTRLTASLALIAALALAACQPPADAPATETSSDAAVAPVQSTAEMPADAPPQEEAMAPEGEPSAAAAGSCTAEVGEAAAVRLAERCTMVSPASHPPCNPDNACALIQGEIDRACGQYGPGETKPGECSA